MRFLICLVFFVFSCHSIEKEAKYDICLDSETDRVVLSYIMNAECGICSEEELNLVGSTVLNRAEDRGMTLFEVVTERGQFSGYGTEHYTYKERVDSIAIELLKGCGRNYEVYYFFRRDAYNQGFVQAMQDKVIYSLHHHQYAEI